MTDPFDEMAAVNKLYELTMHRARMVVSTDGKSHLSALSLVDCWHDLNTHLCADGQLPTVWQSNAVFCDLVLYDSRGNRAAICSRLFHTDDVHQLRAL